jgi:glycosyltransferase involved in cell wall biosynthesis
MSGTLDNRAGAVHENHAAAQQGASPDASEADGHRRGTDANGDGPCGSEFSASYDVDTPPRLGMPQSIIFDGLNLSLRRGTGIATYTRTLTRAAHDLGHEVGVVYSTPFTPAKNPLLREIAFFDEKRAAMSGKRRLTLRRLLNHAIDQTRYHFPVKPLPVEFSGAVVARQLKRTLADQDRVFVARNLFANARTYFSRTKAFVNLAFEPRPDILHCTYPLPLRVRSARNVYTIHDLVPLRLPFTTQDNKRQIFRLLKTISREADHIVTVSENSKRDIIELLGVEERRITNTYQTVDFPREWIERPKAAIANQLEGIFGLELHDYLLFYGALEPKKNVRRLVDAYLLSGVDVPLVLVTAGGWQNEAETQLLTERSANEGAPKRSRRSIHRLDYVSFATLVTLIRGARAVVFPSLYEGFGLPVLESMVLGTPVVASRESSLPEVAGDAALLVDPYDTDQIARAITTIVSDADLRAELSRRGKTQAGKFSVDRYRGRVEAVYASLR